MKYYMGR